MKLLLLSLVALCAGGMVEPKEPTAYIIACEPGTCYLDSSPFDPEAPTGWKCPESPSPGVFICRPEPFEKEGGA